jgi:DNA-3-methyladenine glycosylase II
MTVDALEIVPRGPFSLDAARSFAGGFAARIGGGEATLDSIVMAFPVEGWRGSALAEVRQTADGVVRGRIASVGDVDPAAARRQVARCLSLDHDGSGWPAVGERDPLIGRLQAEHEFLRPVCFYSAYEAATSFLIAQRIPRRQAATIKARLSDALGDPVSLDGVEHRAFPRPQRLLELREAPGLNEAKIRRLRGLAEAALDGRLDTESLRRLPAADALDRLGALDGVGRFTAEGTLLRGCGVVDELPSEGLTREAVAELDGTAIADDATWAQRTNRWRPFRMWATVLVRVGWERSRPGRSYRRGS